MEGHIAMNKFNSHALTAKEFSKAIGISEKSRETYTHVSALFHTIIGGTNEVAHSNMLDAIDEIKQAGLYRQRVKKACKEAISRYEDFEKRNMEDMRNADRDKRQLYMDYLDSVNTRLEPHIFILHQSIKRVLDRKRIENSGFKARIILVYELLNYSVELFDKFIENCPPCPPVNIALTYQPARLTGVRSAWREVEEALCKDCADINLNDDNNCKMAFDIIETKLVSEQGIYESGEAALALNPREALEADKAVLQLDKEEHKKFILTDNQRKFLKENYQTKTNKELADTIGCGLTKLREFAKELGLTKNKIA